MYNDSLDSYFTHDVEEAYLTDRIILMHEGEVVASGNPQDIFLDNELISKYNLDIPFEVELKKRIKEAGFDVKNTDSVEEIGEKICKSK